jgi:hypothetical protein
MHFFDVRFDLHATSPHKIKTDRKTPNFTNMKVSLLVLSLLLGSGNAAGPSEKKRVLVKFQPGKAAEVQGLLEGVGGEKHYQFDQIETLSMTVPEQAIKGLENNPNIVVSALSRSGFESSNFPWSVV